MTESFINILKGHGLDASGKWRDFIDGVSESDVRRHLSDEPGRFSIERLAALISPAARTMLEQMAQQAKALTLCRFGNTVAMYVPLYVSNYCINSCTYCGFNHSCEFSRTRLSIDEAVEEAKILAGQGFRNLLLLSGEDPKYITAQYLSELAKRLKDDFCCLSVEIYPMSQAGYEQLYAGGIDGVTLYQETYESDLYSQYHPGGPKADFEKRLATYDSLAKARMRRIGLGSLLGLNDWRFETLALGLHANYLMRKYWQAHISFSFPRMRPAPNVTSEYKHLVSDAELVQMMLALRLCFADCGLVLSTREPARIRDNMVNICVTQISAGSKTNPGGYSGRDENIAQFNIDDSRSPAQIADMIKSAGKEPVWKDWDTAFTK